MKPVNEQLDRLLKAAAAAPKPAPGAAVFALEARVLGAWRSATSPESGEFLVTWFRRAAIGACMLALASVAWSYYQPVNRSGAELTIAASAMGMGVEP